MRWMITGATGMLGTDLVALLEERGEDVVALGRSDVDITDPASVDTLGDADVVINCAAYTAVDAAEDDEGAAFRVNAVGPQLLARKAKELGALLVHLSTDYVFPGDGETPYGEYGPLAPAGAYGRTKTAGEWAVQSETDDHLIIRTAWLYGEHGSCFPKTMAKLSDKHPELNVVTDEIGQPTWTRDLADLIVRLVEAKAPAGIYHGTSSGQTNWYGFTKEIMMAYGKDPAIVGETTAAAFNRPAPRPSYSVLGHDSLNAIGVAPIGDWKQRWQEASPAVLADLG